MSPVKNQIIWWGDKDHIVVVIQLNIQVTPAKRKKKISATQVFLTIGQKNKIWGGKKFIHDLVGVSRTLGLWRTNTTYCLPASTKISLAIVGAWSFLNISKEYEGAWEIIRAEYIESTGLAFQWILKIYFSIGFHTQIQMGGKI